MYLRAREAVGDPAPPARSDDGLTKRVINRIRDAGKAPGLSFDALVLTSIGR
jgi:hypothetical protein